MMHEHKDKFEQMTFNLEPRRYASTEEQIHQFKIDRANGEYVECPCCDKKHNIVYKRNLYPAIVKALKNLADNGRSISSSSIGDFAKLRFWEFVREQPKMGSWIVTQRGIDFLQGRITVPKSVFLQNNIKLGESEDIAHVTDYL